MKAPKHYNNKNGSLYKFAEEQGLNSYEFDMIKRIIRSRKKGNFIEDMDKTIFLIELYKKEHTEAEVDKILSSRGRRRKQTS